MSASWSDLDCGVILHGKEGAYDVDGVKLGVFVGVTVGGGMRTISFEGAFDRLFDGLLELEIVGVALGEDVCFLDGSSLGVPVGPAVGSTLGVPVGPAVGSIPGVDVGVSDGSFLGDDVGTSDGSVLGLDIGRIVGRSLVVLEGPLVDNSLPIFASVVVGTGEASGENEK